MKHGVWVLPGPNTTASAVIVLCGVEQPNPNDVLQGKAHLIEVGPQRAVGVRIGSPRDVLDLAYSLIGSVIGHVQRCPGCAYSLAMLVAGIDDAMKHLPPPDDPPKAKKRKKK